MLKNPRLAAATAMAIAAATTVVGFAPAASAHQGPPTSPHRTPTPTVLADGLLSPLRVAVTRHGTAFVSQNFAGEIDRVSRSGDVSTVYTDPNGNEVGGLSIAGRDLNFTVTQSDPTTGDNTGSWLKVLTPNGAVRTVADLFAYEQQANPDQGTTYGFRHIDPTCAAQWPTADNGPATYTGTVDSHPYATYAGPDGWTFVADAGANDVLLVSPWGAVSTIATLPAIPYRITTQAASGLGLASCFVGLTYWFEPVPTDITMGPDGTLLITSLPGGPEGPQLGARGSVFAIGGHGAFGRHGFAARWTAHLHHHGRVRGYGHGYGGMSVRPIVTGLMEPTGLAASPRGDLYVAELFGDTVARITFGRHGVPRVTDAISTPSPGDVEWSGRSLYVTSNVLSGTDGTSAPAGQLLRYRF